MSLVHGWEDEFEEGVATLGLMRANRTDGIYSSQGRTKGWMYFGDELRKDLHRGDSCSEVRTASTKLWEKIALALCRDLEVKLVA